MNAAQDVCVGDINFQISHSGKVSVGVLPVIDQGTQQNSRLRQPLICAGQEVDHNVEKLQCDLREARAELARLQKVVTVNQVAMTQSQQALYKAEVTTQQLMRAVNMMVGKSKRLSRAYI